MGLRWRYNLTRMMHAMYFSRKAYYRINNLSDIDNVTRWIAAGTAAGPVAAPKWKWGRRRERRGVFR